MNCEAKRELEIGRTELHLRCDLYAGHGAGRHRTVLNPEVTLFWEVEK